MCCNLLERPSDTSGIARVLHSGRIGEKFALTAHRRLDEVAASLDQQVKRVANEDRIFLLLGNKQGVEKVLLLARCRSELAGNRLFHTEAGLIRTAAGLMRVEVGHRRESVEQRLAIISRSPLEQLSQAGYGVEGPR